MWIKWILVLPVAIILDAIESTSPTRFLPNDEPDSSFSDSSLEKPLLKRSRSLARRKSPDAYHSPADCDVRGRSRSPPPTPSFENILGFSLEDLRRIRLKPYNNPTHIFELQNYTFPLDTSIRLITRNRQFCYLPAGSQIVMSRANGDVFAISEKRARRGMSFRGLFQPGITVTRSRRAMINIYSGEVKEMNEEEAMEYPLINQYGIRSYFHVYLVNDHTSQN